MPNTLAPVMVHLSHNDSYNVVYGGRVVLREESYTVASSVMWSLQQSHAGMSECDEVATAILADRH